MPEVTIVALPSADESVNKISSEQVPHLTLMYLGEQDADVSAQIVEFAAHAATQLSPFGLSVDYRGKLGVKDADVLFFEDNAWDLERISSFRFHLLQDNVINLAYLSTEQFDGWTPHLTLGYPEAPANEDDETRTPSYVFFDRIAVWVDNYQGPEFRLKYGDHLMETLDVSHMDTTELGSALAAHIFGDGDELAHYGVKGMRWGVTTVDKSSKVTVLQDTPAKKGPKDVVVTQEKKGTFVKTHEGQRHPATDEAIKAAAGRQKAKRSTTDALTNAELKATIERMQLEQQFAKLEKQTDRRSRGRKIVDSLLGSDLAEKLVAAKTKKKE